MAHSLSFMHENEWTNGGWDFQLGQLVNLFETLDSLATVNHHVIFGFSVKVEIADHKCRDYKGGLACGAIY
jgi:hypothetical protein